MIAVEIRLDKDGICGLLEECFEKMGCERIECVMRIAKVLEKAARRSECGELYGF